MGKRKLGRGLAALLGRSVEEEGPGREALTVGIDEIRPNPWQPRGHAPPENLEGLIESIRLNGVLQPIVLRRATDGGYELVAGERRWRAAKQAGLTSIPAVVRSLSDTEMLLLALHENIQREDLNAMERAHGYTNLMRNAGWTQEQLAERLSEARTTVANIVRLLELPEEIQGLVSRGTLTAGHGRALLAVRDPDVQMRLCRRIIAEHLSVREVEAIAGGQVAGSGGKRQARPTPAHIRELQERLQAALGAKVFIRERKRGGRITIDFKSHDDFDRILAVLEGQGASEEKGGDFHV